MSDYASDCRGSVWLFQRWMKVAANDLENDLEIKPAKVLYTGLATPQERAQLKAQRRRADLKTVAPLTAWGPRRAQGR